MGGPVKLSEVIRYHRPPNLRRARQLVDDENGNYRLVRSDLMFTVFSHNMALLTAPAPYLGTDRDGARMELVQRLKIEMPDIVGLCEVFVDEEREKIRNSLGHIYPYYLEGPDEADFESDGGILLMSRHPIVRSDQIIYRNCAGWDCLANKGVLYMRIHLPQPSMDWDIFYTHTQNIEESGGRNALYSQLSNLGNMIRTKTNLENTPCIVMGDLNIPGESSRDYLQLINRLGNPIDLWSAKHVNLPGDTYSVNNNFYNDPDDTPSNNSRLDYILLFPSNSLIPILDNISIINWARNGRNISDHFGLFARFDKALKIEQLL